MKKMLIVAALAAICVGCSSTRSSLSAGAEPEPTVAELSQQVKDLKSRLLVLELDYKVREQRKIDAARHRAILASNNVNRVRSKSKLIIQPKAQEGMNLLGERFPVKQWQIRQNHLNNLKFKSSKPVKPKMVQPLTPDSRAIPPAVFKKKEDTSINDVTIKKEEGK